ncbi:Trp biosynthesis-associated membrane protein [Streptosporangium sp. KLBMP 9127]|nr:Trp biosynthesis-associated membrane protein [Streptosporangium sp. KLBMP 9127]
MTSRDPGPGVSASEAPAASETTREAPREGPPEAAAAAGKGAAGRGRGELGLWVLLCAAGAGLTMLAAGGDWTTASFPGGTAVTLEGTRLTPVLIPLALAAGAGTLAVPAARGVWRRAVAVVVALCGAGILAGVRAGTAGGAAMEALRDERSFATAGRVVTETAWLWPGATIAGGLVLVVAGVAALLRGGRWSGMSDRYDSPAGRSRTPAGTPRSERAMWDAIDGGDDPTTEPPPDRGHP